MTPANSWRKRAAVAAVFLLLVTSLAAAQTWTQLFHAGGPPATRAVAYVAYDPGNNRMIVFGGSAPGVCFNDTWILTNADGLGGTPTWEQLSPTNSPSGRETGAAGYDPATNTMIIYGGDDCSGGVSETWVLTNANGLGGTPSWMQLNPTGGPPNITQHAHAVYDSASNRLMVFGGLEFVSGPSSDQVWVLSNANGQGGIPAWTQLFPSGTPPGPTRGNSLVYDASSNRMVTFGSFVASEQDKVHVLENANGLGGSSNWILLSPAGATTPSRANHSAVYDADSNHMVVFGGADMVLLNDVWTLSHPNGLGGTPEWSQLTPGGGPPAARGEHSALFNPTSKRMIVYSGINDSGRLADLWVLHDQPPVADAGPDQTIACATTAATAVTLDGSGSHDPDSTNLTFSWTGPFPEGGGMSGGENPTVSLPLGVSTINLVVNDGWMDSDQDSVSISVVVGARGLDSPLAALVPEGDMVPLPQNAFKQGRILPLKLQISCGSAPLTAADVAAPRIIGLLREGDALNLSTIDLDAGQANDSGVLFRFEDGSWVYNLSTKGLAIGTYTITIEMPDGQLYTAGFVLR